MKKSEKLMNLLKERGLVDKNKYPVQHTVAGFCLKSPEMPTCHIDIDFYGEIIIFYIEKGVVTDTTPLEFCKNYKPYEVCGVKTWTYSTELAENKNYVHGLSEDVLDMLLNYLELCFPKNGLYEKLNTALMEKGYELENSNGTDYYITQYFKHEDKHEEALVIKINKVSGKVLVNKFVSHFVEGVVFKLYEIGKILESCGLDLESQFPINVKTDFNYYEKECTVIKYDDMLFAYDNKDNSLIVHIYKIDSDWCCWVKSYSMCVNSTLMYFLKNFYNRED